MALKRFVDGAAGQPFFQKRAPENLPDCIRTATLTLPVGRTADEIVIDDAAGLAWVVNLGCIDLNPHPVRAEDLDHPDELRVDLDPVPGVAWAADPRRRAGRARVARGGRARRLAQDVRLARHPHQRPDRAALDVPGGPPRGAGPRARRRAAGARARDVQVVEGGAPRRLPRLQPERQGPDGRVGVLGAAAARRARVDAADLGRGADRRGRGVHDRHRPGAVRRDRRPGRRHRRGGRLARGAARAVGARRGARGWATPRGRRTTRSRPASRRASSRRARAGRSPSTSRGAARRRPAAGVAAERAAAVAAGDPNAGLPTEWAGSRPTPTGRRKTSIPVVEIARAEYKEEALEGLERWKARHPEVVPLPRAGGHPGRRRCAAARRSGTASGSTSSTSRRRTGRPRSRSSPTSTRGPARTSRPGRRRRRARAPGRRRRRRSRRRRSRRQSVPKIPASRNGAVSSSWS